MTIKEQLLKEIERAPEPVLKELLDLARAARARAELEQEFAAKAQDSSAKPIWEIFLERSENIPAEELAKLPTDGAVNHDHYLYRTPKREE